MKRLYLAAVAVLGLAAVGIASAGPPVAIGASSAQIATVDLNCAQTIPGNTAFAIVATAREVPAPSAVAVAKLDADRLVNSGAAAVMAPNVGMGVLAAAIAATTVNSAPGLFYNKSPPGRFDT